MSRLKRYAKTLLNMAYALRVWLYLRRLDRPTLIILTLSPRPAPSGLEPPPLAAGFGGLSALGVTRPAPWILALRSFINYFPVRQALMIKAAVSVGRNNEVDAAVQMQFIATTVGNVHDMHPPVVCCTVKDSTYSVTRATWALKSGMSTSIAKTCSSPLPSVPPGTRKMLDADQLKAEKIKASPRTKVEHFRYIKQVFGYSKVHYRCLAKNVNRLHLLAAFANLLRGQNYLLA